MTSDPRAVLSRPAPPPDLTLRYGEHPDQIFDLRLPSTPRQRALVVLIHGGFWRSAFDRAHTAPMAAGLVGRGHPVASLEFRRVGQPGGGWPGTFDDVLAALAALPKLIAAARPGVDVTAPVLAGHSSGGHLALWAAAVAGLPVRGVLALAPVSDLRMSYDQRLGEDAVAGLLGGSPDGDPRRCASIDPAALLPIGAPLAIVHGALDQRVPAGQSRTFAAAASAAGDTVRLTEVAGAEHFAMIDPESAAWPEVLAALDFLDPLIAPVIPPVNADQAPPAA